MPDRDESAMGDRMRRHQVLRERLNSQKAMRDPAADVVVADRDMATVVLRDVEPDTMFIPRPSPTASPLIPPPPIPPPLISSPLISSPSSLPAPPGVPSLAPKPSLRRRAVVGVLAVLAVLAVTVLAVAVVLALRDGSATG